MQATRRTKEGKATTFVEAARRAQIIEAAIDTLAELGYAKTTFARIAERAGLSSTGLISYHFASKDELMEQLVTEVYTRGARAIIPRILAESTAAGMLRTYIEANLEFVALHRNAIAAVIEVVSNLRKPDGTLRFDATSADPTTQGTEWILQQGQEKGEFREFDIRVMALAIRAAIDRSALLFRAEPGIDWQAYAREVATLFDRATRRTDPTAEAGKGD